VTTLKAALTKSNEELAELRAELETKAKESGLNAYVGFESSGEGVHSSQRLVCYIWF
jgi:aspartyl-tRNA(Asn)/glutamyl-tRNA(Gln) amidotransferase subunit A